jgi:glycerol-3-phosphate dehydrogenase
VECIQENRILRRIAPGSFEENGGLFVALTDEDMDYRPGFLDACAACGIPARELTTAEALRLEPGLNPAIKAAVWVPDATMDAMRLPLRFFASARRNGAKLHPFTEVVGLLGRGGVVSGVAVHDHLAGGDAEIPADLVSTRPVRGASAWPPWQGPRCPCGRHPACCWHCGGGSASWSSTGCTRPATVTSSCPSGACRW